MFPYFKDCLGAVDSTYIHVHIASGKKKLCPERPDTLDALDVSDATCLTWTQIATARCVRTQIATAPCVRMQIATAPCVRMQIATAPCVRTQIAMASAYRTERGRAFSFWIQPYQGIFLLDTAVSGHFPTGRVRMTRAMAPRLRWLLRNGTSQQILGLHSQTRSGFQT